MTVPQPFQYQGSQRALAPLVLQYLPISTTRLVEPFCGSAALSIAAEVTRRRTEAHGCVRPPGRSGRRPKGVSSRNFWKRLNMAGSTIDLAPSATI